MQDKLRDSRYLGFIIGFGGVVLIGLLAIAGWLALAGDGPTPTLPPTTIPVSERVPAETQVDTPRPGVDDSATPTSSPAPTQLPPTPTRPVPVEHTVREGDTLFGIALAYGISVETIQQANDLTDEIIVPGQVLVIPPGPLPTPTPYVEGGNIIHTVSSGETLIGIAEHYSVTVESIRAVNELDSEIIQPGQKLRIPAESVDLPIPAATVTVTDTGWRPSILQGNLAAAYPLTLEDERFTMHYPPDLPTDHAPNEIAAMVESALNHIETRLQVHLEDHFDVYIAGSLFASEDTALRGRSFSEQRRSFYLFDDSGTPDERRYMITHELTHLVVLNAVGRPSSVMLQEGVAMYTGIEAMEAAGFLPLQHFCAAYQQAGQLPRLSGSRPYSDHIRDFDLLLSAGCFATYLIDEYGIADFKRLFTSGDYLEIYEGTFTQHEAQWIESLEAIGDNVAFDPEDLVASVADLADAYDLLFTNFSGTPSEMAAYRELDQARIAMLQGRFKDVQDHLNEFDARLKGD